MMGEVVGEVVDGWKVTSMVIEEAGRGVGGCLWDGWFDRGCAIVSGSQRLGYVVGVCVAS